MGKNKKSFFWPSFVDLMTNLFAVTLVLFVFSYFLFKKKEGEFEKLTEEKKELLKKIEELSIEVTELRSIKSMSKAIQSLNENKYFLYDTLFQKHILQLKVVYETGKFRIPEDLEDKNIEPEIRAVGESIVETTNKILADFNANKKFNSKIKFLIVLEGQSSSDGYNRNFLENNNVLSYNRALALREFWKDSIQFPSACEIIVSGSGEDGNPREPEKINDEVNRANQRFLVHIVPVIDWAD